MLLILQGYVCVRTRTLRRTDLSLLWCEFLGLELYHHTVV